MFNGEVNFRFYSEKPKVEVHHILQENFDLVGLTDIAQNGAIQVQTSKFDGFAHSTELSGNVRERNGDYNIYIQYKSKLNVFGWIILGVGFFLSLIGLGVLYFPYKAKRDLEQKLRVAQNNILLEIN